MRKRNTKMRVTVYIVGGIIHVLEGWVGEFEETNIFTTIKTLQF